jgi:hypothetical protein
MLESASKNFTMKEIPTDKQNKQTNSMALSPQGNRHLLTKFSANFCG